MAPNGTIDLKSTPMTVGLLVALILLVVTIVGWSFGVQDAAKDIAKEVINNHSLVDPELAHPGLKRYVRSEELKEAIYDVKMFVESEQRKTSLEIRQMIERVVGNDRRNVR